MRKAILVIMIMLAACSVFAGGSSEKKDGPVTITYYGRPDVELEREIIASFEAENPGIKVNYVELPSSSNDRLKTIQTVLQSQGTEMDVFAGDACWPAIFISAGWVTPLDEYISPSVRDSFISTMLTAYTFNGQTYGLPFMADVCALYYRDDLLSKYGLDVPETYDELLEASKTIMAGENNPDLYGWGYIGVQNETLACCFLSTYWALGGPDMVNEESEFVFDYEIAEEDHKYRHDGYSTSYYYYGDETKFEAGPNFNENPELIANGDKVDFYFGFGYSTDNVKRSIFITKNHEALVICPTGQTPCIDETEGTANYTMFIRFDIEYFLPQ